MGTAQSRLQPESPQPQEVRSESKPVPRWKLATRVAFRFAFVYLMLYNFPAPFAMIPGVDRLFAWNDIAWQKAAAWTATHILHLPPLDFTFNGSGDTTPQYIVNGLVFAIALLAMPLWTLLDRRRANYSKLHEWLRLDVRMVLGATLISYGAVKVIQSQFPTPALWRLFETYGESSPMGLLWTFMGFSRPYNVFAGSVEMLGGILILIPRLTTLGALVGVGAMTNVFVLNMSYDVPVKIYSLNLLLMCGFLLLPDARRLLNVFILNRDATRLKSLPLFQRGWLNQIVLAVQLLFLLGITGASLYQAQQGRKQYGDLAPLPALYGVYNVEQFTVDGRTLPPLYSENDRWRRVTFERGGAAGLFTGESQ